MIFGITSYGLAAVAVLLSIYGFVVLSGRPHELGSGRLRGHRGRDDPARPTSRSPCWHWSGSGSVWTIRIGRSLLVNRRLPPVSTIWQRTIAATAVALAVTVVWALATGHGIGNSALSLSVSPFNETWREAVAITAICSGAFLAIVVAWFMSRKDAPIEAGLYVGTGRDPGLRRRRLGRTARRLRHGPLVLRGDRRLRDTGGGRRRVVDLAAAACRRASGPCGAPCSSCVSRRSSSASLSA